MAVGPVRALLTAHLQATWNRSLKELTRGGARAMTVLLILLLLIIGVPFLLGLGALGHLMGTGIQRPFGPMGTGLLLTFMSFGGGIAFGIIGGGRTLQWESYRSFPLRLRSLFLAELLAGMGDVLPLLLILGMAALFLGAALARPALGLLLPSLWVASVVGLLSVQHLVSSLAGVLVKRLHVALILLGLVAWSGSALAPSFLPGRRARASRLEAPRPPRNPEAEAELQARLEAGAKALDRMVAWLPHGQAARGLRDASEGLWGRAWLRQLYVWAGVAVLATLAARTLAWEAAPASPGGGGKSRKLWNFRTPVTGLARLAWESLLGTQIGKFGFLIPLMTLVLIKGPFAHLRGSGQWGLPGAFAYLSLTASQLAFNQFGFYHHGIKALLLLPLRPQQLLLGQTLGFGAYMGLQALILSLLLGLVSQPPPGELAASLCLAVGFYFVQVGVGHFTSVAMPRAMPRDSFQSGGMPLVMVAISLGTSLGCGLVFGGAYGLCLWLAPTYLLPAMALLAAASAFAYWLALPLAARYLAEHREKLVEVLG